LEETFELGSGLSAVSALGCGVCRSGELSGVSDARGLVACALDI